MAPRGGEAKLRVRREEATLLIGAEEATGEEAETEAVEGGAEAEAAAAARAESLAPPPTAPVSVRAGGAAPVGWLRRGARLGAAAGWRHSWLAWLAWLAWSPAAGSPGSWPRYALGTLPQSCPGPDGGGRVAVRLCLSGRVCGCHLAGTYFLARTSPLTRVRFPGHRSRRPLPQRTPSRPRCGGTRMTLRPTPGSSTAVAR